MNLDSKLVQKTMQSLLTDVAPRVLTPDISNVVSIAGDGRVDDHNRVSQHHNHKGHSAFKTHHKRSKKNNKTNTIV